MSETMSYAPFVGNDKLIRIITDILRLEESTLIPETIKLQSTIFKNRKFTLFMSVILVDSYRNSCCNTKRNIKSGKNAAYFHIAIDILILTLMRSELYSLFAIKLNFRNLKVFKIHPHLNNRHLFKSDMISINQYNRFRTFLF
ncbi:hypothetical protein AYI70_g8511 [Smittium culicis]|uniref:Uncharacterized protein n=1 Tax=Smittium culicis TaxID=133412 RepID=A0A1R1XFK6_9FUNG|nr:hypothetical protein AYI70_g8511 [Smittium culicis]